MTSSSLAAVLRLQATQRSAASAKAEYMRLKRIAPRTGRTYYGIMNASNIGAYMDYFDGKMVICSQDFEKAFQQYIKKWILSKCYEGYLTDNLYFLISVQDIHPSVLSAHQVITSSLPIFYLVVDKGNLCQYGRLSSISFLMRDSQQVKLIIEKLEKVVKKSYCLPRKELAKALGFTKWYQWWFSPKFFLSKDYICQEGFKAYEEVYGCKN